MEYSCDSMHCVEECRDKLIEYLHAELSKPELDVNTEEVGKVTDMIKDLAETEKNCFKAWYYWCKIKDMDCDNDDSTETMNCQDHYNAFKASTDPMTKNSHIQAYMNVSSDAMREMYGHANMDTKKKMRADLTKLVSEMN